jgi:hypothetical protein
VAEVLAFGAGVLYGARMRTWIALALTVLALGLAGPLADYLAQLAGLADDLALGGRDWLDRGRALMALYWPRGRA